MLNFARYTADSHLTSSLLQHGDVRREDIVSCIDVTMMDRSAHSALPLVSLSHAPSSAGHPYSL